jgi:uracil-DNA glycosylase
MQSDHRRRYLQAMGIDIWIRRSAPPSAAPVPTLLSDDAPLPLQPDRGQMGWDELRQAVAACVRCELHKTRTQTVFGVGDLQPTWLIIGEAPGADEDRQGEPFVGRAGQLLNAMLRALGLKREEVFIANILKCRPPNNRDPRPEEVACCAPFLKCQIQWLKPKIILAVGRIAGQNLLKCSTPLGQMRGRLYHYEDTDIPVVVTYHPAYLLRSPREKRKAWQDLLFAKKVLSSAS